jgi:dihydropyrimidine dehydrogenase (NAD+) subunit PreT
MTSVSDIAAGRLAPDEYARNFADVAPPLNGRRAAVEANRCYFCHDAPCVEACPTGIDIPGFIRAIATGNLRGAAVAILEENVMGGMCARVCPTEVLCEGACVRMAQEGRPVEIGALQRHATDWLFERRDQPFRRLPATGRHVAVVGAGPAGLSCAHRLATLGHEVTVFEARAKPGGLNEYGIAAYKAPDDVARREVDFILSVGGIRLECGRALGRDLRLTDLRRDFDAVFLGLGHNAVNALGVEGEGLEGVMAAVDFIADLRQACDKAAIPVGRRVVVIGGGNTAIDVATQCSLLGAEDVTIVYRRGAETMPATGAEREWAQTNGVRIRYWSQPRRLLGWRGKVREVEFEHTRLDGTGRLVGTGQTFRLPADQVFKAIGQRFVPSPFAAEACDALDLAGGRIAVNEDCETSIPGVFAGGDCVPGADLTVSAVQDGKIAAHAIDRMLAARHAAE